MQKTVIFDIPAKSFLLMNLTHILKSHYLYQIYYFDINITVRYLCRWPSHHIPTVIVFISKRRNWGLLIFKFPKFYCSTDHQPKIFYTKFKSFIAINSNSDTSNNPLNSLCMWKQVLKSIPKLKLTTTSDTFLISLTLISALKTS